MRAPNLNRVSIQDAASRFRGVFYGWKLVGISAVLLTIMSLTVFQGLGTFLVVLEHKFGWSRTTISFGFALARAQGSIIGPFEGMLVDRVGIRKMVFIGYSIMGFGFILLSRIDHLWQFYGAFAIVTIGAGLGGWLAMITLVNNWFIRKRSIALATALSGVHIGGLLIPLLAFGMASQGFRNTTLFIGLLILVVVVPATQLIRNRPEDIGQLPDGSSGSRQAASSGGGSGTVLQSEPDFTVREALATPVFWLLILVQVSSSSSTVALATHLVPKLTDFGMSLGSAGFVVMTWTAVAIPSQFLFGYLADRYSKPPIIFGLLILQAASLLVIALADNVAQAYVFAVMFGVAFGGRMPLTTAIRGDYFGRRAFATITGLSYVPNNLFTIVSPVFAAYLFHKTGSYLLPFSVFAAMSLSGAVLVLFVRRPRQKA